MAENEAEKGGRSQDRLPHTAAGARLYLLHLRLNGRDHRYLSAHTIDHGNSTEMPAAISPYSMTIAPDSLVKKRFARDISPPTGYPCPTAYQTSISTTCGQNINFYLSGGRRPAMAVSRASLGGGGMVCNAKLRGRVILCVVRDKNGRPKWARLTHPVYPAH